MTGEIIARLSAFVARYYRDLDSGDVESVACCFAENGVWHRKGAMLSGSAEIIAALQQRDPDRVTAHMVTNFSAEPMSDNHWQTSYYLTVYDNSGPDGCRVAAILACTDLIAVSGDLLHIVDKKSRKHLPARR